MVRAKRVRRFWWFDESQLEEIEAWLSDMAVQGWHFSHTGCSFAVFEQGEPEAVRYRCDVFRPRHPELEERLEFYRSAGWEYVCSRRMVHVFRAPADNSIPEIHTDPQEQAHSLTLLQRRLLINSGLLGALMAWLLFSPFLYLNSYWLEIMLNSTIPQLAMLPIFAYILILNILGALKVSRRIRSLDQGIPRRVIGSYQRGLRWTRTGGIMVAGIAVIILTVQFVGVVKIIASNPYPEIPGGELPVPRLSDLISKSFSPLAQSGFPENIRNNYRTSGSFLVPEQWNLLEYVEVPGMLWPWQEAYTPSLEVRGYRARTDWLARSLACELAASESKHYFREEETLNRHESSVFESLWIHQRRDGLGFTVIVQEGSYTYYVNFHGMETIENMLKIIREKVFAE